MKTITPSERRALEAVARGEVRRVYRKDGNVFKAPPGLGAATLWRLASRLMIADGPSLTSGIIETHCKVMLTLRGQKALALATNLQPLPTPPGNATDD